MGTCWLDKVMSILGQYTSMVNALEDISIGGNVPKQSSVSVKAVGLQLVPVAEGGEGSGSLDRSGGGGGAGEEASTFPLVNRSRHTCSRMAIEVGESIGSSTTR